MAGPWTTFWTLTYSHTGRSVLQDSRAVHGWIRELTNVLRSVSVPGNVWPIQISAQGEQEHQDANLARKKGERKHSIIQYAWAIENHKSGFPHVHIATNVEWVCFHWLRLVWETITGASASNIDVRPVYQVDGVCKYLSKYVSKGGITPDLLGIWSRRRLWATTRKREKKPDPEWIPERVEGETHIEKDTEEPHKWGINEGWKVECFRAGVYAMWTRPDGWRGHVARELDTFEADELETLAAQADLDSSREPIKKSRHRAARDEVEQDLLREMIERICLTDGVKVG